MEKAGYMPVGGFYERVPTTGIYPAFTMPFIKKRYQAYILYFTAVFFYSPVPSNAGM